MKNRIQKDTFIKSKKMNFFKEKSKMDRKLRKTP